MKTRQKLKTSFIQCLNENPEIHFNQLIYGIISDYNAFKGGLKSALRRTLLTTKDTKGAQSLNLGHKAQTCTGF